MKLHNDRDAFKVLIESISSETGYRTDVLEKDYYVVLILKELSEMQILNGLPAYFKGGTALYKALKTTNRFSEDIDLSVDACECSRTQSDKRLERSTKKYSSLIRDSSLGKTNRSEVETVYLYDPVTSYDENDALQRFGRLKIEATTFTISEPVENLEITPLIYEAATEEQKKILEDVYDIKPFIIKTITMERIFIDKLFAAEAYVRNSDKGNRAFEAAKHIYDLAVICEHSKIKALLSDEKQLDYLLSIRIKEELGRLDGIPNVLPKDFMFFTSTETNQNVRKAYETMQRQYVFRDEDRIDFDVAIAALKQIEKQLLANPAWLLCKTNETEKRPSVLERLEEAKKQADEINNSRPKSRKPKNIEIQ